VCDRGNRYNEKEDLPIKSLKELGLPEDLFINPEKYQSPRMKANFLLWKKFTPELKKKLSKCSSQLIDYMRKELQLETWECYWLVRTLFEEFPIESLLEEK